MVIRLQYKKWKAKNKVTVALKRQFYKMCRKLHVLVKWFSEFKNVANKMIKCEKIYHNLNVLIKNTNEKLLE